MGGCRRTTHHHVRLRTGQRCSRCRHLTLIICELHQRSLGALLRFVGPRHINECMQGVDDRFVCTQGLTTGAEERHLLNALRKVSLLRERTHRYAYYAA